MYDFGTFVYDSIIHIKVYILEISLRIAIIKNVDFKQYESKRKWY